MFPLCISIMEKLHDLYYLPKTGLRSANALYMRAKQGNLSVSRKTVSNFYKQQATTQEFLVRPVRTRYPLRSLVPLSRIQIDLLDVSNQNPQRNKGYHFILNAIDIYTRKGFSEPIKNKTDKECLEAFKKIVREITELRGFPPTRCDSDKESAFMSDIFQKYCEENEITQHFLLTNTNLGLVEHFNREIRKYIEVYKTSRNTRTWYQVLPDFVHNFNTTYNRNLKGTPEQALAGEVNIDEYILRQVKKANEQKYNQQVIQIGDKVRVRLHKTDFEKKTKPTFSSTLHTVEEIDKHQYFVSGRVNPYLKSDIQKVGTVQKYESPVILESEEEEEEKEDIREEEKREEKERRVVRRINKEGIKPHKYSGDPTNSLEYRFQQELQALPKKRGR